MHESKEAEENAEPRPHRRRKWKRWLVLVLFAAGLVWLNGPGLRWLVPKVASRFLASAGFRGGFGIDGSFTGGFSVTDLHLESATTLADLTAGRVTPLYRVSELLKGKVDGIRIDGLHADLVLGLAGEKPKAETPFDLEKLVQALRSARGRIMPLTVDLSNISLKATKDGKPVIELASSGIQHAVGEAVIAINLGAITDAAGREWPAEKAELVWNAEQMSISRLDPLPGVSLRDFVLRVPASGGPSADAELRLDDAVFMVGAAPGFSSVSVDLREGRLQSETLAGRFGLKLPASAAVTSLSVNVDGLLPDPAAATGAARLLFEDMKAGDWVVPELSLDVGLEHGRGTLEASGRALGTPFSVHAEVPVQRTGGAFKPGDVQGHLDVAEVSRLVASLAERFPAIDPEAPAPASVIGGDFHVSLADLRPSAADVELSLKPADPKVASAVNVKARWLPGKWITAEVGMDGLSGKAEYDPASFSYEGAIEFDGFQSARIARWLAVARARMQGEVSLSGTWHGGGTVKTDKHCGALWLAGLDMEREGMPSVHAGGGIDYDWPGGFTTKDLRIEAADQAVAADARLAGGLLEISNLRWRKGAVELAGGAAKLPVPADFSQWRAVLAHDTRPLDVSVESKELPLALLKDWFPAAGRLDARSTGRVSLKVSGTYAVPVIDALVEAKNLRSPEQPKLPPADLRVTLVAKDGRLSVDGRATARDFAPAVMTASLPFRPAQWAENPELIRGEPLTARADLPRIDVSRFSSLVADARKVSGMLSGNIEVAGEIGKPAVKGRLDLTGGGLELKGDSYPAITGVGASMDLALDRVTLRDLKATIAGGTLAGGGFLAVADRKPGALDLRLVGNHLPVVRDDSLIVRANADLRLAGTWDHAALTGTVGVVDSLFYRDIELLPIGTPFTAPSAAALPKIDAPARTSSTMPEPFRDWTLNVLARTENPFLIRGNFATGKVEGSVRIGGSLASPAPDGELRISDFRAALPFSTLTVRSGTVSFKPATGFDPVLEIRGSAEPRPYRVSVYVYGRASDPQLVLTSSPPLPENEIMTLLATGTTTSGLENPQAASSRAMQLLAEELRRGRFAVGKQLRPVLGLLDRVDFSLAEADPYSNSSFSTATISLTDRWLLSAGMGAEGDSRVLAIWRLSFR